MEKQVLHNLNSGLVLDRSLFVDLTTGGILSTIQAIRAAEGKTLYVVDSAEAFFTPQTLVYLLHENDSGYLLVNEGLGNFFTDGQIKALTGGNAEMVMPAGIIPPAPPNELAGGYTFDPVPDGWSISANMSLGATKIKRKVKNPEGDGTMFFMSPQDFEKLWLFASKFWLTGNEEVPTAFFNTGVGVKKAVLYDDMVVLGGNHIRRYELEQVAKYRNWAMPQAAEIAA